MNPQKIALITDSSCDLSDEILERYDIGLVPLRICFADKTYRDRVELSGDRFYPMLERETPKSSLPAAEDITAAFDRARQKGYEKALFLTISSGLSGTYQFVKMMAESYEGLEIHCLDTKILSCGQGSLVVAAARVLQKGGSLEDAVRAVSSIRSRMSSFFVVQTLTYLSRGGRIGKVAGTVGSLLHLNPVITVNNDGVYETAAKTLGFARALDLLAKEVESRFRGKKIVVSMVHALNEGDASRILARVKGFADVMEASITPVTAVLGAHTGPGLVGLIAYEA